MENQENQGKVLMKKYEVGRLLGQGTFAKVYYARDLKTGRHVAIKAIDKEKVKKVGIAKQTKREITVMGLVRHKNVMELYEVMATKTKIYFVMEYAKGGELFQKVAKGKLKEDVARKYFQQLICAVKFCHGRGVYHRDLKLENLLLDDDENLKVTDFGLSAIPESRRHDGMFHTTCGTPAYVAPEVINKKGYDAAKADIWSCGVILYILIAGYLPFFDANLLRMYEKVGNGEYKCPKWFSPEVRALLARILDPNPNTRISMAEIMEDPWFQIGLDSEISKNAAARAGDVEKTVVDPDSVLQVSTFDHIDDAKLEAEKVYNLNAFDIISLSNGLNLSGLFANNDQKDEVQFTSAKPASAIISKMEEIASHLKLEMVKKDQGSLKLEGSNFSIDVEIFEICSSFHLVEVKKSNGDSIEYQSVLKKEIRPALRQIVWAWQGEQRQS